jgi:hypothetical protein
MSFLPNEQRVSEAHEIGHPEGFPIGEPKRFVGTADDRRSFPQHFSNPIAIFSEPCAQAVGGFDELSDGLRTREFSVVGRSIVIAHRIFIVSLHRDLAAAYFSIPFGWAFGAPMVLPLGLVTPSEVFVGQAPRGPVPYRPSKPWRRSRPAF